MNSDDSDDDDRPELDDDGLPTPDQFADDLVDMEGQKRLWLRAIIPLLNARSHDSDPSDRVQLADDLLHIAACERAVRILRSDLPDDQR